MEKRMRKLLIVVGPSAGAGFLTLPVGEDRTKAGQDGALPSFWTESLRTGGERAGARRDGRSCEPGDAASAARPRAGRSIRLLPNKKSSRRRSGI
jgi:hypothetical protein